jgi:hypothetical protein
MAMKTPTEMTTQELKPFVSEWFRRDLAARKRRPRAKIKRPCPHCNRPFGARDLKAHKPRCPKREQRKAAA